MENVVCVVCGWPIWLSAQLLISAEVLILAQVLISGPRVQAPRWALCWARSLPEKRTEENRKEKETKTKEKKSGLHIGYVKNISHEEIKDCTEAAILPSNCDRLKVFWMN